MPKDVADSPRPVGELEQGSFVVVEGQVCPVMEGLRVRPHVGVERGFEALSDAELIEVSTPELDDVVRHADDYGRAGPGPGPRP